QDQLYSFLQQYDAGNLNFNELPASLQSATEIKQLNEGLLQLLPDLTEVGGRSMFIDQLIKQLDSSNPSGLYDMFSLGNNLQTGPSPDPLLSAASSGGMYAGLSAPGAMPATMAVSNGFAFDLTASPEGSAALNTTMPLGGHVMVDSNGNVVPMPNPTLNDLALGAVNPAVSNTGSTLSDGSAGSISVVPDSVTTARPIARPRGYSNAQVAPQPQSASLYSHLYTPAQLQQAQQKAIADNLMSTNPYLQRQRAAMPHAQIIDPAMQQAHLNTLMAYRAMGLQCKAPEDEDEDKSAEDEDAGKEVSLEEWLDAEKLTDLEIAGTSDKTAAAAPTTSVSKTMDTLPTPVSTPAAVAASEVDEPELEDTEESERSFIAKNAD
ncbi:hypothetical protein FBU59_006377, partial [Linderina macrospora]